jgi:hypothetical protein
MDVLIIVGLLTAFLFFVDALAAVFGVDTRPDFDDPHKPTRGLYV